MPTAKTSLTLDERVLQNIQITARRLERSRAVPGMDAADYEQDLLLDLIRRSPAFDASRASFRTFADRLIRHRAITLCSETEARKHERSMVSLDATITDEEGNEHSLIDLLPDEHSLTEETLRLVIDLRRFVEGLSEPERQGCELLLNENISDAAQKAGINRSTAYERIHGLRDAAVDQGLRCYLPDRSNSPGSPAVSEQEPAMPAGPLDENTACSMPQTVLTPRLYVTDNDLCDWLRAAPAGDSLEYFRGFLIADRAPSGSRLPDETRRELSRIAERARSASDLGLVHLMQRRYGRHDYGYRIVARRRSPVLEVAP